VRQVKGEKYRFEKAKGSARGKANSGGRKIAPAREDAQRILLRRPILALSLGLIVVGGGIGLFAGGHVARLVDGVGTRVQAPFNQAGFTVRTVALNGEERTSQSAAHAAIAVPTGSSIFGVRPDAIRARLLMLPWVADAEVRRHLPDSVSVRLIEKRPFALWRNGTDVLVVERSGAVITKAGSQSLGRLPLLAGAGAPESAAPLIDALAGEKATTARLQLIQRVGERRWDLILSGGVTVRLPEEGWERQLTELERLIVEKGILERDIEMIDLRYPDNYVFRLHNGDSRPVARERHA
jgi:cell division protein FtsQ